jgi:uncharacterized small protein (DUF1192 family)
MRRDAVNFHHMDIEELSSRAPGDPLALLCKQDLDPLSVEELTARIEALQSEIERSRRRMEIAVNHRANADQLFKR